MIIKYARLMFLGLLCLFMRLLRLMRLPFLITALIYRKLNIKECRGHLNSDQSFVNHPNSCNTGI